MAKLSKEEREAKVMYNNSASFYHDYRTKINPKGWFYNEYVEMPSTLELLGDVKGKKILDYGCGSGIYAQLLTKKGAKVKGFDISIEMLKIAKTNNPSLEFREGSGYKIPFNEKFHIIIASLVVHYMKDWDKMFREMSRVLNKGGIIVFSTGNPVYGSSENIIVKGKKYKALGISNYFEEGRCIKGEWKNPYNKKTIRVFSYHKTYEDIIGTILRHGFEIIGYKDCLPDKSAKNLFPEDYAKYSKMPIFMAFKVRKK